MWETIDEAVSLLTVLRSRFSEKYRISFSSWNRRLFVIAIYLSVQDYAIRNELGPEEVEKILFSGFIVEAGENCISIDSYNGERKEEELRDFFLKMLLVWEAGFVPEDKREQFLCTILFYPFLAVLENVKANEIEYRKIYEEYTAQKMWEEWDGRKIKWTKESCEEEIRVFWRRYSNHLDVIKQQKMFELLDRGYALREKWYMDKTNSEAEQC